MRPGRRVVRVALPQTLTLEKAIRMNDPVSQLRTRVVECALAWQIARTEAQRGTADKIVEEVAARELDRVTKLYRAATR